MVKAPAFEIEHLTGRDFRLFLTKHPVILNSWRVGEGIGVARAAVAGIIAQLARSALTPVCPSLLSVWPGRGNSILALQLSGASDEPGLG